MGCICTKHQIKYQDLASIAAKTYFSKTEVEALRELYWKLSSCLKDDGVISKEEFQLGLLGNRKMKSIVSDRIFQLFDYKDDGVIDFAEFVQSLSIFHPDATCLEKAAFSFQVFDIRKTGFIEWEKVKQLVLAFLDESELMLPSDIVDGIINKTFEDADTNGDGKIDLEEWNVFVARNPSLIKNMTIPHLKDPVTASPSFMERSGVEVESSK